jgi:D-alanyl-D-alanine carboxypeptidase
MRIPGGKSAITNVTSANVRRRGSRSKLLAVAAVAMISVVALAGCQSSAGTETAPADATTANSTGNVDRDTAITSVIDDFAREQKLAGTAVIVDLGHGNLTTFTGYSDLEATTPMTADVRSAYRSITKSFTVTVILQLVDEGKVDLDAPVSKYLSGIPRGDEITLRMLAGMRSGLPEYTAAPAVGAAISANPEGAWTTAEILNAAFALPNTFAPGTEYAYTNTNTVVLGAVIQAVTGRQWDVEVQTRINDTLGLASVEYPNAAAPLKPFAQPYEIDGQGWELLPIVSASLFDSAGGLFGTVTDLHDYGVALGTGKLTSEHSAAQRTTGATDVSRQAGPEYDRYGLGMGEIDGWWGHTGVGLGYEALTMTDPNSGHNISILMNTSSADHDIPAQLYRDIRAAIAAAG